MKLKIGASTGWLYGEGIEDMSEQQKIIEEAGGNSIEISLRDNNKINDNLLKFSNASWFRYTSSHIPEFSEDLLSGWITFLKVFQDKWDCDCFTIHPSMIKNEHNWEELKNSGLPIALENMDISKNSGFEIVELKRIVKEYNFKFVLDIQHAFSHDHTMKYARELFEEFKDGISHIHVSGEADGVDHVLVKDSDNKECLIKFLKEIFSEINVPIIIEGKYIDSEILKEEINFIKSELSR